MSAGTSRALSRAVDKALLVVHRAGFEVRRDPFQAGFAPALRQHGITDALDIGANTGQFATELRRASIAGRIVSVEPLRSAFEELEAAAATDPGWTAVRAAVSDAPGSLTMNVSANSVSSSVLPMLDRHAEAAPSSGYVATEEVPATTVDALVAEHGLRPEQTLLKIDVQGYESSVLDGARDTLARFGAVRTEMSLVALYEGQALFAEMFDRLTTCGFDLWFIEPGFAEPGTRRLLQLDGSFFRREA